MTRAYTLDEIDDMRRSVGLIVGGADGGIWASDEAGMDRIRSRMYARAAHIEDMLRTYIVAGVDPKDLRKKATGSEG